MVKIDDVTISKKVLGRGFCGTVYKATYKGNKYVYKISKILKSDIKTIYKNEVNFAKTMNKYDGFMKLYDHKIEKNCKHKQLRAKNIFIPKHYRNLVKRTDKSKYCSLLLYNYIDGVTLSKYKLDLRTRYKFIYQLLNIIKHMRRHGWIHSDIHINNLLCKNKKITLIDYGIVIHTSDKSSRSRKILKYNYNVDIIGLIFTLCIDYMDMFKLIQKRIIIQRSFSNYIKKVIKTEEYKNLPVKKQTPLHDRLVLFEILYHRKMLELSVTNTKITDEIVRKTYYKCLLDKTHIIYLIKNASNIDRCIQYISKLMK